MKKLVFLISGKKHSGKTSLVESFVKVAPTLFLNEKGHYPDWYSKPATFAFGDELKKFCSEYFEIPLDLFYSEEGKASLTKYKWQDIPGIYKSTDECLTVRDFMQVICNDIMGSIFPRIWINKTIKSIKESPSKIIFVSDWRFIKEDNAFIEEHNFDIIRIRLNRYVPQNPINDKHISETNLDNYPNFNYIIDNQNMNLARSKSVFKRLLMSSILKYYELNYINSRMAT